MSGDAEAIAAVELRQRQEALEVSGWGRPFTFLQPHNLCFWTYVVLLAWGTVEMWQQLSKVGGFYGQALVSGVILVALYGILLGWIFRHVDRYEHEPYKLLAAGFLWGGVAATFAIAIGANEALSGVYGKVFGHAFVTDWSAALSAPFVEETAKAAGFVLLLGMASRRIRSVQDGLLVGAFIGLGFELFEDLIYALNGAVTNFGVSQTQSVAQVVLIRGATGLVSHALFTALFCAGLIYVIGTPAVPVNRFRGFLLIIAAVVIHGVWDGAEAIADGGQAAGLVMLGIGLFAILVLVFAFRRTAPQERLWMRAVLAPEVTNGTITPAELDAAAGTRRERRKFVRAPRGHRGHKGRRHVLEACRDLAEEISIAEGGETPAVEGARGEVIRLRRGTQDKRDDRRSAWPTR
jgi:RsiW-degrading membrane proteinase PrsW (M82 family)